MSPSNAGLLSAVARLVRAPEWWAPKLAPLLAIAYLEILLQQTAPAAAYPTLLALLAALTCLAAYGHTINDVCDVASDRAAGKPNGMAALSRNQRALVLAALAAGGVLPWLLVRPAPGAAWVWGSIYVLLTLYSAPPVRLKERGLAGVLTDAAMAHAAPTLFVCLLFAGLATPPAPRTWAVTLAVTAWALCVGLRNILIGQLWDYANDIRSGTVTFTVEVGPDRVRRLGRYALFPSELVALALLLLAAAPALPWLPWVVVLAVTLESWKVRRARFDPAPLLGGHVALHDLYQVWLPVTLSAALAIRDWRFAPLPVLQVVLFRRDLRNRGIVGGLRRALDRVTLPPLRSLTRLVGLRAPVAPASDASGASLPHPRTCYVICATPRSGSNLLCAILSSAGLLGRPQEYFLPWYVMERDPGQWDPTLLEPWRRLPVDAYLRKIVELGCTPNGAFGVKIMWSYLDLVIAKLRSLAAVRNLPAPHVLPTLWPNLKYIHIIRRDKMRQAVSLAKAVQSGMWVDLDPAVPSDSTRQLKRVFAAPATRPESTTSDSVAREPSPTRVAPPALRYDFRQLMALYRTLQGQDNAWQAHFRAADVEPLHVFYEDLIVDHRRVATTVAGFLGIDGAAQVTLAPIPMRRQADATNDDWVRRFSHELAGFAVR